MDVKDYVQGVDLRSFSSKNATFDWAAFLVWAFAKLT